ncbi:hypothetical protein [Mucilaginibacter terrae]|uniref:Uncharacterized protein n=1 Tax=Mucilaginibacter terrae TaxID=1955052 RepID=A0ABU3GR68_9SPHI|nr:hypothetical protein [Mucilaginibacter terrae]MDT3402278.1 hypothetical protein [Mucilaginibacter terrae]
MRTIEPPFDIESNSGLIHVSEHSIGGERVFHLEFADMRKPLNILVAEKRPSGEKFWTSTPEGRQEEAEHFGRLIAAYIRSKRKKND